MTSQYAYGVVAERRLMAELREEGFAVTRASSSKGNFDVIAIGPTVIRLYSVKRVGTMKQATTVYRAERRRLEALEVPSTPKIQKVLAIWVDVVGDGTRGGIWHCQEVVKEPLKKETA